MVLHLQTVTLPYKVGPDGRGGEQPRGTKVVGNIAREIGLWQKQSSLWFQVCVGGVWVWVWVSVLLLVSVCVCVVVCVFC
jgi:hypothetical protein